MTAKCFDISKTHTLLSEIERGQIECLAATNQFPKLDYARVIRAAKRLGFEFEPFEDGLRITDDGNVVCKIYFFT